MKRRSLPRIGLLLLRTFVCPRCHTHPKGRIAMNGTPQVFVTLSADLVRHLRRLAGTMHVPIQWMVAGLVCDTIELVPVQAEDVAFDAVRRLPDRGKNRIALTAALR